MSAVLTSNAPCEFASSSLKIVFVGNVGSGKTTALSLISETPIISTEAKATEHDALHRKATTTVGLEYGITHINGTKLHIYGTPGQRRFDFMATIACKGLAGMVILIDNGHPQPLAELKYFLQFHRDYLKNHPAIVGITHYDDDDTATYLIEYHNCVFESGFSCPVMLLDARQKDQVSKLVKKLYLNIIS